MLYLVRLTGVSILNFSNAAGWPGHARITLSPDLITTYLIFAYSRYGFEGIAHNRYDFRRSSINQLTGFPDQSLGEHHRGELTAINRRVALNVSRSLSVWVS
jgi:hypothetical protein